MAEYGSLEPVDVKPVLTGRKISIYQSHAIHSDKSSSTVKNGGSWGSLSWADCELHVIDRFIFNDQF